MPRPKNTPKSFWAKVAILPDPDACWLWTDHTIKEGYGMISWSNHAELAHRIAYQLSYSIDPDQLDVLHTCDNPRCCNPKHLFLGTHQDNMKDMKLKGRAARNSGESAGKCKLLDSQVKEIRAKYVRRRITLQKLALEYGVTAAQISNIIRGKQRL